MPQAPDPTAVHRPRWLFWANFIALIATSFCFVTRSFTSQQWAAEFDLDATQVGQILGVGLWPFAISIVLFSLVVDKIGYGRAMVFAFCCHVASVIVCMGAGYLPEPYWGLYGGIFLASLANGTVEAVINPVIASVFPREKTKWLTILHAGFPGGMVLGGLLTIAMNPGGLIGGIFGATADSPIDWRWSFALVLIPTFIYGLMMLRVRFPVSERVAAGVPYRAMLSEAGVIGMALVLVLIVYELLRVMFFAGQQSMITTLDWSTAQMLGLVAAITAVLLIPYAIYVRFAPGRWLFVLLMFLMIPLATTELGTDTWIKELMKPVVTRDFGIDAGWVLIYTASIMIVLRFSCSPLVRWLGPLGILAVSSAFAAVGISFMSTATGVIVVVAATIYGIGQSFFWPATLGVVAERFPRGGALTLNAIAGVGMLGVGIVGGPFLGAVQDKQIEAALKQQDPALFEQVAEQERFGLLGPYRPVNPEQAAALGEAAVATVTEAQNDAKRRALLIAATLPAGMFVCYLILIGYFKARGGYEAEVLAGHPSDQQAHEMVGGVEGPVE